MFWTSDRCSANLLVGCEDVSPQAAQTRIEADRTQWDASSWQQEYLCSVLEQLSNSNKALRILFFCKAIFWMSQKFEPFHFYFVVFPLYCRPFYQHVLFISFCRHFSFVKIKWITDTSDIFIRDAECIGHLQLCRVFFFFASHWEPESTSACFHQGRGAFTSTIHASPLVWRLKFKKRQKWL